MIYGLDIGGTKIEFARFDIQLRKLDSRRVDTPTGDFRAFIDTLVELVESADRQHGTAAPLGVGMPGLVDRDGRSLSANVPCASGRNVALALGERLRRPVAIENDCRLFALSEARGGAGSGYRHVYGAVLGTGAAGGLVIDGELYRSRQGIAGEYGHQQLPARLQQKYELPLLPCGCGLSGCMESYIAGPGLVSLHRHFAAQSLTVPQLVQRWRDGDTAAAHTVEVFLDLLGAAFANMAMACDPDIIVLGGGLSRIDELYTRLPTAIEQHLFSGFRAPAVAPPKFGDASGARGAALLVQNHESEQLLPESETDPG